jgi:hypothetical protein
MIKSKEEKGCEGASRRQRMRIYVFEDFPFSVINEVERQINFFFLFELTFFGLVSKANVAKCNAVALFTQAEEAINYTIPLASIAITCRSERRDKTS